MRNSANKRSNNDDDGNDDGDDFIAQAAEGEMRVVLCRLPTCVSSNQIHDMRVEVQQNHIGPRSSNQTAIDDLVHVVCLVNG